MPKVRFGILACSSVARRRTIPAILAAANAHLERIGSRSLEKAQRYAAEFGCGKSGTYEDVLRDDAVDAIYISTPPAEHEHWILEAARYGKHVYCEKPAVGSYAAACRITELFAAKGLRIMEGYMFRYHPQHRVVQDLIRGGRIGVPKLFQGWYLYPYPQGGNFRLQRTLGGGVFRDAAGYLVAAVMDIFSEKPTSVFCDMTTCDVSSVDDFVGMLIEFSGGRRAQTAAAFGLQYRSRYAITGTAGRVEVQRAFAVGADQAATIVLETDQKEETIEVSAADQFKLMIDDFSGELLGQSSEKRFEQRLLDHHQVMDAALRSYREKRRVLLNEYSL